MAYTIREVTDPRIQPKPFAEVESIEAAEAFLREHYEVLCFERDDEEDGADALVAYNRHSHPIHFSINPAD